MEEIDQLSQWCSSPIQTEHNIYATLHQNLQRYELKHRSQLKKPKSFRINRLSTNERNPLTQRNLQFYQNYQAENKENQQTQDSCISSQVSRKSIKHSKVEEPQQRSKTRVVRSSLDSKEEMKPIQMKELRFEHRDRKKAKDKWVNIFAELKSGRHMISLKQIDSINKQNKEEKIDLFLKLLKR